MTGTYPRVQTVHFAGSPETKSSPALHPPGERIILGEPGGIDTDEAGQGPASELHRAHMRLTKGLLSVAGADPDHQRRSRHATAHIALDQEREAAHHLLFRHIVTPGQQSPYPPGSLGVITHRSRVSPPLQTLLSRPSPAEHRGRASISLDPCW